MSVASTLSCDLKSMHAAEHGAIRTVRVALGWRARDVERESSAHVAFADQDDSVIILEDDPVALAYADPQHGFVLPPGRFVRADQIAGRVFEVTATPHLTSLTSAEAVTLADTVTHLLEHAGWARATTAIGAVGIGVGARAAVAEAVQSASAGQGGFGVAHVGTWRVPRGAAPWAALPAGTPRLAHDWDGAEAYVTVRPVGAAPADAARLIVQVRVVDAPLTLGLIGLRDARRARFAGAMQTLRSWDAQPNERVGVPAPR